MLLKYEDLHVLIDFREKGSLKTDVKRYDRAKEYYTGFGLEVNVSSLETGDYVFRSNKSNETVVFEYKTIFDYMNSLYDNSLFEEAVNQALQHDYSFVMIEGNLYTYMKQVFRNNLKLEYDSLEEYCKCEGIRLGKVFNGSLRRLRSFTVPLQYDIEEKCFKEMLFHAQKCLDNKGVYGGVKRSVKSPNSVEFFLSGCAGVSSEIIRNIMSELEVNGLEDLLKVTKDDLLNVDLVGDKRADNIFAWIHQKKKNGKG